MARHAKIYSKSLARWQHGFDTRRRQKPGEKSDIYDCFVLCEFLQARNRRRETAYTQRGSTRGSMDTTPPGCILTLICGPGTEYDINVCSLLCSRRRGRTLSDTAIRPYVRPSVCPSLGYSTLAAWRSCLGYRHAGCLQLAGHQRCADCGPVRGRT